MSDFRSIKFDTQKTEFVKVLKKRVNQYFKDKNISKYNRNNQTNQNIQEHIKTPSNKSNNKSGFFK